VKAADGNRVKLGPEGATAYSVRPPSTTRVCPVMNSA
jgi:hypothetical protein